MLDESKFAPYKPSSETHLIGGSNIGNIPPMVESAGGLEVGKHVEKLDLSSVEVSRGTMMGAPMPMPQTSTPQLPVITNDDASTAISDHYDNASDSDVIEKAWVDKAKNIVTETRNNPRLQNDKLAEVKAAYIKLRYGKDVKIAQENVDK